ncbi:cysteine proteinase [Guyanagaster necrorhizus]|uniref:Ubiquitin carboxyl-terminal hydrolase n=1 Tax=Guyanagaster necrorhizus TaxID=856835 RepID=A0A9P7VUJ2_9AGAR|nr:cysteine proteinase [Guyanagaster necrorhizus MCA 3950]KAG7446980.1 cysteine proteinase [Guyanagaster necrorhizus MCA 3950]
MAKLKSQSPQELYRARRQREERVALLPPGLINNGNTCFMNSVLQGLIATRLLSDLIYFKPISPTDQFHSETHLASRRSPLLTNGVKAAGKDKQDWVATMPIGDVFVNVMLKAWDAQRNKRRESQSPRALLGVLGRKYDQYLDFAQQDAHEFMRILLDAMRMEELDVIKKRQPPSPPEKAKRRRRRTLTSSNQKQDDDDKLLSFPDMIFGGKLTSVLVCQKCKHVSQTYEDFNDLSLSIKLEDYAKERKRDRLRNLAKRLTPVFPATSNLGVDKAPVHRSSSAPPSPREPEHDEPPITDDPRRRSLDALAEPSVEPHVEDEIVQDPTVSEGEKRLEFGDLPMPQKKDKGKDDGWAKLGRRFSVSVGLSKAAKERRSRSKERRSIQDFSRPGTPSASASEDVSSSEGRHSTSEAPLINPEHPDIREVPQPRIRAFSPLHVIGTPLSRASSTTSIPRIVNITRGKSPKPPKPSQAEQAYLRKILADVTYQSAPNPFALLNHLNGSSSSSHHHPSHTSQHMWLKMGQLLGIEECLKMFTAVEILDGENMVGCRRCWKVANGLYKPRLQHDEGDADSDSLDNHESPPLEEPRLRTPSSEASTNDLPTSLSSPNIPLYSHSEFSDTAASIVSLPTTIAGSTPDSVVGLKHISSPMTFTSVNGTSTPGGLPIPSIAMTEPPGPGDVPSAPSDSDDGPNDSSFPNGNDNTPSNDIPPTELFASKHSLLPAPTYRQYQGRRSVDASDDSSDGGDSEATSGESGSAPKAPIKKKPKPVIMRPAYKRYLVATPPPVLVVHLKRFQQISKTTMISFSNGFKKLDDYVTFPEILDLTPFLAPKKEDFYDRGFKSHTKEMERCLYRLYAVVVHIGNMLGGHYIAYTALPNSSPGEDSLKTPTSADSTPQRSHRQWAYISDTIVRLTTLEEVLKAKAYICMYERI